MAVFVLVTLAFLGAWCLIGLVIAVAFGRAFAAGNRSEEPSSEIIPPAPRAALPFDVRDFTARHGV